MGTRSLTFVYDENKDPIINMYGQWDGYPKVYGLDLANFLSKGKYVNGLNGDDKNKFNGMPCMAAQIVARFKVGAGSFYLYPVTATEAGQDYDYHVYKDSVVIKSNGETVFEGNYKEFKEFCKKELEV